MIVMKFGGTSVGNATRIIKLTEIVKNRVSDKPIVVVSAFSSITNYLKEIGEVASKGKPTNELFDIIINRHFDIINELGLEKTIIKDEIEQLKNLVTGISLLQDLTPRIMDNILSFGERMSSRIIAEYMIKSGVQAKAYDAFDIDLITTSDFGNADVLEESYLMINQYLSNLQHIPIITGFIGKNKENYITTLGRGGSDYTATIIGAAVNSIEIEIWTDVNGIMTADPKIVKNAKTLEKVSLDEASELAFLGAKVLHPRTMLPAMKKNIPVKILNSFNPTHKGTVISNVNISEGRVASITHRKNITVINISTPRMFETHGFLKKIFEIFDKNGISIDMVSTSEINISVTIDGGQETIKLEKELREIANIDIKKNRTMISLVGHRINHVPNVLSTMFYALKEIPIEMISSSMSEINQSFIVKDENADTAICKLHYAFFGE